MAELKTRPVQPGPTKIKTPQKPGAPAQPAPLPGKPENKQAVNRLIDYFETKA